MAYNQPRSGGDTAPSAWQHVNTRSVAFTVLAALVILCALRHVFGTVTVSAGTK